MILTQVSGDPIYHVLAEGEIVYARGPLETVEGIVRRASGGELVVDTLTDRWGLIRQEDGAWQLVKREKTLF